MFGGRRGERPVTQKIENGTDSELYYMRDLTIEELRQEYHALPPSEHSNLFERTEKSLLGAVRNYAKATSRQDANQEQIRAATRNLNQAISQARELDYPTKILASMSSKFIDLALDDNQAIPKEIRWAAACVGNSIGGDNVPQRDRVRTIAERSRLSKGTEQVPLSGTNITRTDMAEAMYASLGVANVRPAATLADRLKDHAKPITLGSAMAAIVTSAIITPSIAHAAEVPSYVTAKNPNASSTTDSGTLVTAHDPAAKKSSKIAISIDAAKGKPDDKKSQSLSAPANNTDSHKATVPVEIKAGGSPKKEDAKSQKISQPVTTNPDAKAHTAPVAVTIEASAANTVKEKYDTGRLTAPASNPDTRVYTSVDPTSGDVVRTNLPKVEPVALSKFSTPASSTGADNPLKHASLIESIKAPENPLDAILDTNAKNTNLTPEQQQIASNLKAVKRFVIDNNVQAATSIILKNFHDKAVVTTQFDAQGNPVYGVSNKDLASNIDDLTAKFQSLIKQKGHKDANGVNMALMTFSVLKAASVDQSVLNSPDVKKLVSGAVKPGDEYQGKLFDQYANTAKQTLEADNGKLLSGISDANKAQIEALYSYALMAGASDDEQAKGIQAIKDAEAAAAAAKKAAEEAAKNAANNPTSSVDAEAINNIVSRHSGQMDSLDGASTDWRAFMAMQYIMAHSDYTPVQVAGIVGNLIGESSVMPSRNQVSGGVAKGIAQWEGERFDNLVSFAESRGKPWTDFETQLDFLLSELQGRGGDELKQATDLTSASKAFMYVFETPYVVVHGYDTGDWSGAEEELERRSSLGQPLLDAFNAEAVTVNAARAQAQAAAEAAAKAAQNQQDLVSKENRFKDSTDVACSPNTPEVRNDTGYYKGDPVQIKLCALPNTSYDGSPALVNARAAELAFQMFEQMRKDLGLDVVTLNDAFRTMAEQEQAYAEYGAKQAAEPGYSNHQMGFAFDINMGSANGGDATSYVSGKDTSYPGNPVWEWLNKNAEKYHFYQYSEEGWHWSINGG